MDWRTAPNLPDRPRAVRAHGKIHTPKPSTLDTAGRRHSGDRRSGAVILHVYHREDPVVRLQRCGAGAAAKELCSHHTQMIATTSRTSNVDSIQNVSGRYPVDPASLLYEIYSDLRKSPAERPAAVVRSGFGYNLERNRRGATGCGSQEIGSVD